MKRMPALIGRLGAAIGLTRNTAALSPSYIWGHT